MGQHQGQTKAEEPSEWTGQGRDWGRGQRRDWAEASVGPSSRLSPSSCLSDKLPLNHPLPAVDVTRRGTVLTARPDWASRASLWRYRPLCDDTYLGNKGAAATVEMAPSRPLPCHHGSPHLNARTHTNKSALHLRNVPSTVSTLGKSLLTIRSCAFSILYDTIPYCHRPSLRHLGYPSPWKQCFARSNGCSPAA